MKQTLARAQPAPIERSLANVLVFAGTAMCILWVPLVGICNVDGLRMYRTWPQIARDFSLLTLMVVSLTCIWCWLSWTTFRLLMARLPSGRKIAWWAAIALPMVLCLLQLAYAVHTWLGVWRVQHASAALLTPRWIAAMLLILGLCVGPIRIRGLAIANHFIDGILELRAVAAAAIVLALLGALWLVPGPSPKSNPDPANPAMSGAPNIVLISLDTLAAADADVCGSGPDNMPRLRQFAAGASCFDRFYAASNATSPAMASMETGLHPWQHWAVQLGGGLPDPIRRLSLGARLKALGYTTHYVGPMMQASPSHRFTQSGYDTIDPVYSLSLQQRVSDRLVQVEDSGLPAVGYLTLSFLGALDVRLNGTRYPYPPKDVYAKALERLQQLPTAGRPWFVWMHSMQPHAPYLPPAAQRHRRLAPGTLETWAELLPDNIAYKPEQQDLIDRHRLRYQENMLAADQALGDMLDELALRGLLKNTVVVVTGDHGESFSHGWLGHGSSALHEDVLRIPLVIRLPGQKEARLIPMATSQVDLAPSLLELAGAKAVDPTVEGRSFAPALQGKSILERPIFAMAMQRQSRFKPIGAGDYTMIVGHTKLHYNLPSRRYQLFDLATDPGELHDIAKTDSGRAMEMLTTLQSSLATAERQRQQALHAVARH